MSVDEERRRKARRVAEARYGFLWHLPIYIVVNLVLVAVWLFSGAGFPWPIFPIFFWGSGVVGHYIAAYRSSGQNWVDRETDRILRDEDAAGKRS